MKNYCDICFKCNDTESCCCSCEQFDDCVKFEECFDHIPCIMWGLMTSLDDILRCNEKWRLYNEQTIK